MGMLIDGVWQEEDHIIVEGAYQRQTSVHNSHLTEALIQQLQQQPGRYHLIGSWTCPWSHRTLLIRRLKRLEHCLPLHITGGEKVQGYPAHFGKLWQVPGSTQQIRHLHQLYTLSNPTHTGRATVPILWDSHTQTIVSDESARLLTALDQVHSDKLPQPFSLAPEVIRDELQTLGSYLYERVNNGVYRAAFAQKQEAYQEAVDLLFDAMSELNQRLSQHRMLIDNLFTEADIRLLPTLVRFDMEYHLYGRCTRHRLTDFPHLWAYARDLYQIPGVAETVHFSAIQASQPHLNGVACEALQLNWQENSGRQSLGPMELLSPDGERLSSQLLYSSEETHAS